MTDQKAAILAAIEKRYAIVWPPAILSLSDATVRQDVAYLLSALRAATKERDEARALVEALAVDDPGYIDGEDPDDGLICYWCGAWLSEEHIHEADCAWQTAHDKLAAWRGDKTGEGE